MPVGRGGAGGGLLIRGGGIQESKGKARRDKETAGLFLWALTGGDSVPPGSPCAAGERRHAYGGIGYIVAYGGFRFQSDFRKCGKYY